MTVKCDWRQKAMSVKTGLVSSVDSTGIPHYNDLKERKRHLVLILPSRYV